MNGGYKIIDFDGYSLAVGGNSVTIPGIYDNIAESKKTTLVENLVVSDDGETIPLKAFFADFVDNTGSYVAVVFSGQCVLTVTNEDAVTLTAV